ncbi:Biogenesis of lysosome-related organelles complex 1 subunit 6 [Halotydeus destructor]|nr:Biogenesis of lysosome-related organelles complex 1 subunit 6 [Halotydeus destructor]
MENVDELLRYQKSVIETIQQENQKQLEATKPIDLDTIINRAKLYHKKLVGIKKDMDMISEKSEKLKVRAIKLQADKQREALMAELEKERQKERDKKLSPVVVVNAEGSKSNVNSSEQPEA